MEPYIWWLIGIAAAVIVALGLMLWVFARLAWDMLSAISRLQHSLADVSASLREVQSAYNRLVLSDSRRERARERPDDDLDIRFAQGPAR